MKKRERAKGETAKRNEKETRKREAVSFRGRKEKKKRLGKKAYEEERETKKNQKIEGKVTARNLAG